MIYIPANENLCGRIVGRPIAYTAGRAYTGATNVNVTMTGTAVSGSGFYDPGSDFPKRIAAAVNGGGVTVNSISFTNPTSITLNVDIAANATPGARTITVTNPDGQAVTSASGIFTVQALVPPVVTLKVNGQHPTPPTVMTNGPMLLTLDMSPSTDSAAVSWYWGLIVNGTLVWVTPNGLSATPTPILVAPPPPGGIFNETLLSINLPPATQISAIFALVDSTNALVAFDVITAVRP